ncbi:MAG: trypsin-like peptidase domain-containing protein [candidate division Zixibacteria bacterium]|nr:trypsin-like peptidase domain-containing protein [candidate division Zixibacteria bacterium]MDD5426678.1 trypsin-like peptidase domain-containing protein [candidate division Zixibacteria bacterium]
MEEKFFPDKKKNSRGLGYLSLGLVAVIFLIIGILIATNLNLPSHTSAEVRPSSSSGGYPVVQYSDGSYESPFVSVVDHVQNAVVNISARSEDVNLPWWYQGVRYSTSSGSGFFFREDGYILTNNHVVDGAVDVTVRTATGYEYTARVVGSDPQTDLAVLKVEPEEKIVAIPFGDSEAIKVGDWAIAIGNPFPQVGLDRTVTVGVISAKGRSNLRFGRETPLYQNYIQTDASINPGNSGGPLLNLRGECIGVNAAISSPTGSSVGIGFAIPINLARAIVPDLIASGKVSRGWLGVWLSNLTEREAKRQGLKAVKGIVIDSVFSDSPAHQAGLRRGDIVTSFNKAEVLNVNQFSVLVTTVKHGEKVPVEIVRGGEEMTLYTTVVDRDTFIASHSTPDDSREVAMEEWLGMETIGFTPEIARQIDIKHVPGLYVVRVYPGTPADRASITEGTIIMQINKEQVTSVNELKNLAKKLSGENRISLIVQEPNGSIARKVIRP